MDSISFLCLPYKKAAKSTQPFLRKWCYRQINAKNNKCYIQNSTRLGLSKLCLDGNRIAVENS